MQRHMQAEKRKQVHKADPWRRNPERSMGANPMSGFQVSTTPCPLL
jgi:hypothetical protein